MGLLDRVSGKTRFELSVMTIGDIRHTVCKKIDSGDIKDTQVKFCMDVLHEELRYLRTLIPLVKEN